MSKPAENKHEKQRVLWTLLFKKVFEVNVKYKACTQQIVSTRMSGVFVCVCVGVYLSLLSNSLCTSPLFTLHSPILFSHLLLLGFWGWKKSFLWAKIVRPFKKPYLIPQEAWFVSMHSIWIPFNFSCPLIYLYSVWDCKVNEGRLCLSCIPLWPWSLAQPWSKVNSH